MDLQSCNWFYSFIGTITDGNWIGTAVCSYFGSLLFVYRGVATDTDTGIDRFNYHALIALWISSFILPMYAINCNCAISRIFWSQKDVNHMSDIYGKPFYTVATLRFYLQFWSLVNIRSCHFAIASYLQESTVCSVDFVSVSPKPVKIQNWDTTSAFCNQSRPTWSRGVAEGQLRSWYDQPCWISRTLLLFMMIVLFNPRVHKSRSLP